MATDHTVAAPPRRGMTILVNSGCTANSMNADRNSVAAQSAGAARSIRDVGAGGLSNAFPELVDGAHKGAHFELRKVPLEESGLSPREIWSNEAQERYVLAIAPADLASFEGQKLYSTGGAKDLTLRKLGAVPTRMTTAEVYQSMSRGTIDGGVMSYATALAYRLQGIVKSATTDENFGSGVITSRSIPEDPSIRRCSGRGRPVESDVIIPALRSRVSKFTQIME